VRYGQVGGRCPGEGKCLTFVANTSSGNIAVGRSHAPDIGRPGRHTRHRLIDRSVSFTALSLNRRRSEMLREWGCQLCNELDPETRRARPEEPRAGVDILERGQLARLLTSGLGGLGGAL